MRVKLHFKEKDGKSYKLTKEVTIKKAKELFEKEYKNDDNIIKVWLTHFGMWHEYHHSTLKNLENNKA